MVDFWQVHGYFFLLFMALFPRLTMLVAATVPFSFVTWIGWLLCPRITAAALATTFYWQTNPIICILAWGCAFYAFDIQVRQYGRRMRSRYKRTVIRIRHRYF